MAIQEAIIRDVMSMMGWQNSFLPISNEENRRLLERIQIIGEEKLEKAAILDAREKEVTRVSMLRDSADNAFRQNLKLLTAHKSQYSTEHHLFKIAEHEELSLKQSLKKAEKDLKELTLFQEYLRVEKEKIESSINKLSEGVQWAKSALAEWRQVMMTGDETKKMIEKFCRMDAGKAEALDSKRKLLHEAIIKQQATLVNVYEEKKALELLLERTGQMYRQAHMERRHLVNTWKDAVSQMNQRETEIRETEVEIQNAKKALNGKKEALRKEESVLKLKQEENRDIEFFIQELNVTSSEIRNRLLKLEDTVVLKSSELLALRKTVQNESQKLNHLRSQNRQMLTDEKEKENLLEASTKDNAQMREKYEKFKSNNFDAQSRLKQIEEILESENKNTKTIQDEAARLTSMLYRSEQQLMKLQESEKHLMLESQALESSISRTKASCKNLERELLRHTSVLYGVDYKIQHVEMRLANMRGSIDEEETKRLEDRRLKLEKLYEDKIKAKELMKTEIARIEEDMRKLSIVYQNSTEEYEKINERLKERKIAVEGGERQLKSLYHQKQERLVEQNLLKIRIAQLEKQIAKQNDKAFSLERHKMELDAAMTDRLIDIKSQQNLLMMKRKCLLEERAQLKADIGDRLLKIEQLKKRYDLSMDLLGKNEDGTLVTAVQIKIEMAQEKYLLLEEGNALNEKIVKAENELKCMENALKLMNFSNDEYRKIFETATESSPEVKKMNELRNEYLQSISNNKKLKEDLVILVDHIELLEHQRQEMFKEFEEVQRVKFDHNDTLLKVHKELVDQETKLERADREMKIAFKSAKKRIKDPEFVSQFEKDMKIRENDERNNSALQQIADLVETTQEMSQTVTRYFLERGLSLPAGVRKAKSQCSWKSDTSLVDQHCLQRYSHRSIISGSSTTSSETLPGSSRESPRISAQQSGLSVVKISFPDAKKTNKKTSKPPINKP